MHGNISERLPKCKKSYGVSKYIIWGFCLLLCFNHCQASKVNHDSLARAYLDTYESYLYGGYFKKIAYQRVIPIRDNHQGIIDPALKAESAFLLAQLHNFLYDKASAIEYYKESMQICERLKLWEPYFRAAQRLSTTYRGTSNEKEVMPLLNKCLLISKKFDVGIDILYVYHELMLLNSFNYNRCDDALHFGKMFLDTIEVLKSKAVLNRDCIQIDTYLRETVNLEMGRCYLKNGDFSKSRIHLMKAEKYFLKIQELNKLSRLYDGMTSLVIMEKRYWELDPYFDSISLYNRKNIQFSYSNFRETNISFRELIRMRELEKDQQHKVDALGQKYFYFFTTLIVAMGFSIFGLFYYRKAEKNKDEINKLMEKEMETSRNISKEKSKYFAILSHELRTPVHAITGLSKLLGDGESLNRENIEAIINSGNHLLHLVNNVLQHNKLEDAGQIKLDEEEFGLTEIINNVIQTTSYLGSQKNTYVQINTELSGRDRVQGEGALQIVVLVSYLRVFLSNIH